MTKKDFKTSAADMFITASEEPKPKTKRKATPPKAEGPTVGRGFQVIPEYKKERLQLLLKPSTKEDLKRIAKQDGISVNELINRILEEHIAGRGTK